MAESAPKKISENFPSDRTQYQIFGRIGKGAFASVFKAYCSVRDVDVAIKVIELENDDPSDDIFSKVLNESKVMLQLRNENIVSSLACFTHLTEVWIVMPMLVASCADILKTSFPDGFTDEKWITRIIADVVAGLEYIHKQNLVHRDLKSGNILLDATGVSRIADFGVSGTLVQDLAAAKRKTVTGTPCWMAPEVADSSHSKGHDNKADIWSLGITCLELVNGKPPYHAFTAVKAMMKILNEDAPSVDKFVAKPTTKAFKSFVDNCLQKDPKKRKNAKDLKKASFLQNPITHAVLASKLQLEGDENPYVKQINADELPESLKQKEKRQSKESAWVFTVQGESQEKGLKDIIAEVQQQGVKKYGGPPGEFIEFFDDDGWRLAMVCDRSDDKGIEVTYGKERRWVAGSNVRKSKVEDLFVKCQPLFPSNVDITPEEFRIYLMDMATKEDGKPHKSVKNALDSMDDDDIETVVDKFPRWREKNSDLVASTPLPGPAINPANLSSRVVELADSDDD